MYAPISRANIAYASTMLNYLEANVTLFVDLSEEKLQFLLAF